MATATAILSSVAEVTDRTLSTLDSAMLEPLDQLPEAMQQKLTEVRCDVQLDVSKTASSPPLPMPRTAEDRKRIKPAGLVPLLLLESRTASVSESATLPGGRTPMTL